jgi:acyl homoserine lactone synthase
MMMEQIILSTKLYKVAKTEREDLIQSAMKLREEVFANELKWVDPSEEGYETDIYDLNAHHIVLLNTDDEVIGYSRLVAAKHDWMMDHCFPNLTSDYPFQKLWNSSELSRFAIDKKYRGFSGTEVPGYILLKATLLMASQLNFDRIYAIVAKDMQRFLKCSGIPLTQNIPFSKMDDGVWAGGVYTELSEVFYEEYLNLSEELTLNGLATHL